jgi:hypothetical protein
MWTESGILPDAGRRVACTDSGQARESDVLHETGTAMNRVVYRELAAASLIEAMHRFAAGDESVYRLTVDNLLATERANLARRLAKSANLF